MRLVLVDNYIISLKRAYEYFTTGDISRLNQAVARNKPKCALSLLKCGAYVNHRSVIPIECAGNKQMIKLLIEYGSDRPSIEGALSKFATDAINSRNHIRQCALITLCATRGFAALRDISQIIARCVWSARLSEFNWD